ncbi:hypothetical protein [Arthrobacter sp. E3]|uniref:hypothetical protein n=1 Tax=Arthrobacter sp. E3 TaxID=517402 RepID=UPI001FFCCD2E|nr:hypothetical protein [Arthrobacter sp. E3]
MRSAQSTPWLRRLSLSSIISGVAVLALVAGLAGGWITSLLVCPASFAAGSCDATEVAQGVLPGVVTVSIRSGDAARRRQCRDGQEGSMHPDQ